MGSRSVSTVTVRRPRWRAYLLLARVSNVPTVWTNVLAGMVVAAGGVHWDLCAQVAAALSLFYIGGMFLNDAFDAQIDARQRPERPIPAADVTRGEAFAVGGALLAAGLVLLPRDRTAVLLGLLLAAAIVFYDFRHKGDRFAPLVMGLCRGLVYAIAAAALAALTSSVLVAAALMTVYVTGLTVVAKLAGANARWLVPLLIAAISIVDAAVIAVVGGSLTLVLAGAAGFPLTLALQRLVPGD